MGAAYVSIAWKDAIAFLVLILILIFFRPTGLLGKGWLRRYERLSFLKRYFYRGGRHLLPRHGLPTILRTGGARRGRHRPARHAEQNRHLCGAGPLAQPHPGADGPVPHGAYGLFRHGSVYDAILNTVYHWPVFATMPHSRGAGRDSPSCWRSPSSTCAGTTC